MWVIIPKKFMSKYLLQFCTNFFLIFKLAKNLEAVLNWQMDGGMRYILGCPVFKPYMVLDIPMAVKLSAKLWHYLRVGGMKRKTWVSHEKIRDPLPYTDTILRLW